MGLIPSSGRSPEGGDGNLVQDSCLENPMDRGAWQGTVHELTGVGHNLVTKPLPHSTLEAHHMPLLDQISSTFLPGGNDYPFVIIIAFLFSTVLPSVYAYVNNIIFPFFQVFK